MNEHFLHFVWKNGLFDKTGLKTVDGVAVEVIDPGYYNRNSGPDFLNARLLISGIEWAGNVEIHYRASSWYDHKHHTDHAYNNVIMHVVVINDREAISASGLVLDTLSMNIDSNVADRYESYLKDGSLVACKEDIHVIASYQMRHWVHILFINRLERKITEIKAILEQTNSDWEETLYRLIAANFGMNINRDPFGHLATKVPLKLIRKHSDNLIQVEALLFGQAGMLNSGLFKGSQGDSYVDQLYQEYSILKSKYNLKSMDPSVWKFHRMRPVNFPGRRISQLAALFVKHDGLFRLMKEAATVDALHKLLCSEATEFWQTHYRFGKESPGVPLQTGRTFVSTVIINSVIPLLFFYGKYHKEIKYSNRAIDLSDLLGQESNRITRIWSDIGFEAKSSLESQGLIELVEMYCKKRKCLNCHIGSKLISLGKELNPGNNLTLDEPH